MMMGRAKKIALIDDSYVSDGANKQKTMSGRNKKKLQPGVYSCYNFAPLAF